MCPNEHPNHVSSYSECLLLVLQGRRHPAEALLSPRDEDREEGGQRRYGRRGADHVTPGPEQASRGGRGRGRARGGRSDRREASYSDTRGDHRGDQGQGAAMQSSRGTKPSKPSAKDVAWNLFSAGAKVLPSCHIQLPSVQRKHKSPKFSLHLPAETHSITAVKVACFAESHSISRGSLSTLCKECPLCILYITSILKPQSQT